MRCLVRIDEAEKYLVGSAQDDSTWIGMSRDRSRGMQNSGEEGLNIEPEAGAPGDIGRDIVTI